MSTRRPRVRPSHVHFSAFAGGAFVLAVCFASGCAVDGELDTLSGFDAAAAAPDAAVKTVVADDDAGCVTVADASAASDASDPADVGSDSAAPDACPDGGCPVVCPTDQIACGRECVDPQSNRAHCGATLGCGDGDAGTAGQACADGQVCSSGSCEASCGAALSTCDDTCVDEQHDPAHCGSCDNACSIANGENVCVAGSCALLACNPGFDQCPEVWTGLSPTSCSVLATDVANCGYCGNACAPANATPVCADSTCSIASCNAGFLDCNDDPIDGCEVAGTTCPASKKIFVTSAVYSAAMGGHAGADANCAAAASNAGLTGTFLAWISDDTTTPASRFTHSTVAYALVDGTFVASNWQGLVSGNLRHAINLTETGGVPAAPQISGYGNVWTGTDGAGNAVGGSCSNWSDNGSNGAAGVSSQKGQGWTYAISGAICGSQGALYCVEQ